MPVRPDLSIVLTAHREGVLAGATARSARVAIEHSTKALGLSTEVVIVLDRANEPTAVTVRAALGDLAPRVLETETGDPGQARNAGIAAARGLCSAFLDADDLWSENWLTEAWKMHLARPDCVAHSACNITFGKQHNLWWHVDSEGPFFDRDQLEWANYWDALSFARTSIYQESPFFPNDLSLGFGHEDWHWNVVTIDKGIPHKPVPGTIHFKRRRAVSQMALVERSGAVRWPT